MPRSVLPALIRAIEARLRQLEIEMSIAESRVKEYEARYGMSSREFVERYERGELGDSEDYVAWYGELKFLELARKEYEELKKVIKDTYRELPERG